MNAMILSEDDFNRLKQAKMLLENPGFAIKLQNVLGRPIAAGLKMLPEKVQETIQTATNTALRKALGVAIRTLGRKVPPEPRDRRNKALATLSGGFGGMFGIAGLTLELPVTTTIMLRSIAEIAREEGEDLSSPEAQIQCVQVLALGGRAEEDDAADSGYYFARAVLAKEVSDAIRYVTQRGMAEEGAPAIIRFLTGVAARFGIVVSEKVAATVVPVVGAASGAVINNLFIDHFQKMAHGHFTIRRLERTYGAEAVEEAYRSLDVSAKAA